MNRVTEPVIPGFGETQRRLLMVLKRRGPSTLSEIAENFELADGTLREHLGALEARSLVDRVGSRRDGPGRPQVVYGLSERGESLFPKGEGELLAEFVRHLIDEGRGEVLEAFFESRVAARRDAALARISGLEGTERWEEIAAILSEEGFMAEVDEDAGGTLLRLCHCPLRTVVGETQLPCRAEIDLVRELVGRPLERVAHMPDGDDSCTYRILAPERPGTSRADAHPERPDGV